MSALTRSIGQFGTMLHVVGTALSAAVALHVTHNHRQSQGLSRD
jgi:hypothetical protein